MEAIQLNKKYVYEFDDVFTDKFPNKLPNLSVPRHRIILEDEKMYVSEWSNFPSTVITILVIFCKAMLLKMKICSLIF